MSSRTSASHTNGPVNGDVRAYQRRANCSTATLTSSTAPPTRRGSPGRGVAYAPACPSVGTARVANLPPSSLTTPICQLSLHWLVRPRHPQRVHHLVRPLHGATRRRSLSCSCGAWPMTLLPWTGTPPRYKPRLPPTSHPATTLCKAPTCGPVRHARRRQQAPCRLLRTGRGCACMRKHVMPAEHGTCHGNATYTGKQLTEIVTRQLAHEQTSSSGRGALKWVREPNNSPSKGMWSARAAQRTWRDGRATRQRSFPGAEVGSADGAEKLMKTAVLTRSAQTRSRTRHRDPSPCASFKPPPPPAPMAPREARCPKTPARSNGRA